MQINDPPGHESKEFIARTSTFKSKKSKVSDFKDIPDFLLEIETAFPELKDIGGTYLDRYLKSAILERLPPSIADQVQSIDTSRKIVASLSHFYRGTIPRSNKTTPLILKTELGDLELRHPYGADEALAFFDKAHRILTKYYGLTLDKDPEEWKQCVQNFNNNCMQQLKRSIKKQNLTYYQVEDFEHVNALSDCKKWLVTLGIIADQEKKPDNSQIVVSFANTHGQTKSSVTPAPQTSVQESTSKTNKSPSKPKSPKKTDAIRDSELRQLCKDHSHHRDTPRYLCAQCSNSLAEKVRKRSTLELYEATRTLTFQVKMLQKSLRDVSKSQRDTNKRVEELEKAVKSMKAEEKPNETRSSGNVSTFANVPSESSHNKFDIEELSLPLQELLTDGSPTLSSLSPEQIAAQLGDNHRPNPTGFIDSGSGKSVTSLTNTTLYGGKVEITDQSVPPNLQFCTASGDKYKPCAIGELRLGNTTIGPIYIVPP